MGQRLADDTIITGGNCTYCESRLWAIGETPKTVYVRFTGMTGCPGVDFSLIPLPPNGRVFTLTQVVGIPCRWQVSTSDNWTVLWYLHWGLSLQTKILLGYIGGATYFQHISDAFHDCVGTAVNENTCAWPPGLIVAAGGFVWVEWKQIALDIAEAMGITLASTLFYEVFQIDVNTVVYKFTDKTRGINIKTKYSLV